MSPAPEHSAQADAFARSDPDPQDITRGSIGRHLLRLSIPSALTNLLTFSTMLVDVIWLGRVSPLAIAAVTTFNYIWFMFALLNQMVGNGSVTLISRAYGAGDLAGCRRAFGETFTFKILMATVVALAGTLSLPWAFRAFGAEPEVIRLGLVYGTIMFWATPLMFSTFTLKTGLRAIGDMKLLLLVSALTAGLNFVLDPIMIFERVYFGPFPIIGLTEPLFSLPGAGMGIAGAAWGTVLAFSFVFIQSFWLFTTGRTFLKMRVRDFFGLSLETSWKIIKIGAPPAAANSMQNIANLFVGSAINTYGVAAFAGQGVNQMLSRLVRMMVFGINMSGITIVGQNLGAGNPQRAERAAKYALLATAGLMLVIGALVYFSAPGIARLFIPGDDPDSLAAAGWTIRILRINSFVFLPFALSRIARIAFEGSGYTKPTMYAVAATTWGFQLPATLAGVYLLKVANPDFIWWIEAAAYSLCTIALYIVMLRGRWKQISI